MTTLEILKAARELLSTPARWTKLAYARDAGGAAVMPSNANAVCWCIEGSIVKCSGDWSMEWARPIECDVAADVASFNDRESTTHADILAAFDRAIAKLEAP